MLRFIALRGEHPTYEIMLCKRGTSVINTNFFRNACAKNEKTKKKFEF